MGIMENKMETTIVYWGYIRDNGKENGNYYNGLHTARLSWERSKVQQAGKANTLLKRVLVGTGASSTAMPRC